MKQTNYKCIATYVTRDEIQYQETITFKYCLIGFVADGTSTYECR